jgi:hypothetical protein
MSQVKTMRGFFPFLLIFLLVACSQPAGDEATTPAESEPTTAPIETVSQTASSLQIAVATNDFPAGQPRIPFILFDGPTQVADAQQVKITAFDLANDPPVSGWQGEATNYSDYEVPYWVVYPELPHAGNWGLGAEITLADGTVTQGQFVVQVEESAGAPAVGSQPPASENRTLETEPDLAKLTSDPTPNEALYQMTIAEAMASGRPSVITFATPAFCQTEICAPVVDSVEAVYDELGEEANFIHVEVYKLFDPLTIADEVSEWGLSSEPWTFVLDENGAVVARLGGPVSPEELTAALESLLP